MCLALVYTNCETLVKEVAQELAFDYPNPEVMKHVSKYGEVDLPGGLMILNYFQMAVVQITPTLYYEIKDLYGSAVLTNDQFFYQGEAKWYHELTTFDWVVRFLSFLISTKSN